MFDLSIFLYSLQGMIQNTVYAFVSILILILSFYMLDKFIIKNIDTLEELKNNNLAVAIVTGSVVIGASLIIALK